MKQMANYRKKTYTLTGTVILYENVTTLQLSDSGSFMIAAGCY